MHIPTLPLNPQISNRIISPHNRFRHLASGRGVSVELEALYERLGCHVNAEKQWLQSEWQGSGEDW